MPARENGAPSRRREWETVARALAVHRLSQTCYAAPVLPARALQPADEVRFEKGGSFLSTIQQLAAAPAVEPAAGDDEADDVAAPDEEPAVSDAAPAEPLAVRRAPAATDVLAGIRVQRMSDGRLVNEAKPEAATAFVRGGPSVTLHSALGHQRDQRAAEHQAIKSRQRAADPRLVTRHELLHGVLPWVDVASRNEHRPRSRAPSLLSAAWVAGVSPRCATTSENRRW